MFVGVGVRWHLDTAPQPGGVAQNMPEGPGDRAGGHQVAERQQAAADRDRNEHPVAVLPVAHVVDDVTTTLATMGSAQRATPPATPDQPSEWIVCQVIRIGRAESTPSHGHDLLRQGWPAWWMGRIQVIERRDIDGTVTVDIDRAPVFADGSPLDAFGYLPTFSDFPADFPAPVRRLKGGDVWDVREVQEWVRRTGRYPNEEPRDEPK